MILAEVKGYLQARGQATLADLALHFEAEPDAVRAMLEVWMRKGRVERFQAAAACGSACNRCNPAATEIYRWSEAAGAPRIPVSKACPG